MQQTTTKIDRQHRADLHHQLAFLRGNVNTYPRYGASPAPVHGDWANNAAFRMETRRAARQLLQLGRFREERPDQLAERAAFAAHVRACSEGGKVALVESGTDCDGVHGTHVVILPAAPVIVRAHMAHARRWADGPIGLQVCRPSESPATPMRPLGA